MKRVLSLALVLVLTAADEKKKPYKPHPLVEYCVDVKLDPTSEADYEKCKLAMLHVKNNHECHRLLEQGHDANARLDWAGRTQLLLATIAGKKDVVAELLNFGKADATLKANTGHTALMYAAGGGHTDLMTMFFAAGVSVDDAVTGEFAEDGKSRRENYDANKAMTGYTALHFACKFQKLRATAMLLDAGASVDAKTETGQTPLDLALAHATKKETKRKFQKLFKQFQQANEETQALEAKRLKDKEKAKIAEKGGEKKDEL